VIVYGLVALVPETVERVVRLRHQRAIAIQGLDTVKKVVFLRLRTSTAGEILGQFVAEGADLEHRGLSVDIDEQLSARAVPDQQRVLLGWRTALPDVVPVEDPRHPTSLACGEHVRIETITAAHSPHHAG